VWAAYRNHGDWPFSVEGALSAIRAEASNGIMDSPYGAKVWRMANVVKGRAFRHSPSAAFARFLFR
jgi:hypothetical protein